MASVGSGGLRLEPPASRRASLSRPRLLDRLRDRFATPVTVVVAPAGFGKTTLLAQAVAENRLSPRGLDRWLACGAHDAAVSSLGAGLCRAMGVDVPGPVGPEAAPAGDAEAGAGSSGGAGGTGARGGVGGPGGPGGPGDAVDALVAAVVEAMWHRSPDEVALIIDDVHEVPAGSPGAALLAALVAALPGNGHLVLSGREPPPVPLARLDVAGHVLRLGQDDLLFTDGELEELADRRGVPGEQLTRCGGWPALAELAARALPGVEAAYLWEEVLAGVDPVRRRDLAVLAHLGTFDDALAAAALGHDADPAALTADLPLVAATAGGSRTIHALWQPHLASAVSDAELAAARRRAGLALAERGDAEAGVRLLIEAGAWDDVATVVGEALSTAYPPVPADVVAGWLARVPESMADGPLAQLLRAVGAVQADPGSAVRDLEAAAEAFGRDGNMSGEVACIAQLAQLAWWSEQPDRLAGIALRLLDMEAAGHGPAGPLACLVRALVADVGCDCPATLAELDRIPADALGSASGSLVDWLRSTALNHLGRTGEALEAADRACRQSGTLHAPIVESARLQARWFLGQVDDVLDGLPPLVERTEATGLRNHATLMAATCCTLLAVAGRPGEAAPYLERARRSAGGGPSPRDLPLVDAHLAVAEAALRVATGDEAAAAQVLADHLERAPQVGTGHAAFPRQRALALWYVLVPASREAWDAAVLGPCFATARDLARTLVAVRQDGKLPARSPALPPPAEMRTHLPLPWTTELALAHVAAGRQDGWDVLDALWPQAQPDVRRHADRARGPLERPARAALGRLPVPPPQRLELRLLGPLELRRDGTPVDAPEWRRERVRSLLLHLVLHRPVARERLGDDLWPALDADAQSRNLRVTLTHLLRVLEPERAERDASFLVRPHGGGLLLHRGEWLRTDLWQFDDLWQEATDADRDGRPSAALESMVRAVDLWRGDPAELAAEEWALPEVEERRLRVVGLAVRAGELLLASGEPDEARRMGGAALGADPWSERAHGLVVAAHLAADDDRSARRALGRYRAALADLGVPHDDTETTLRKIVRRFDPPGGPGRPGRPGPPGPPGPPPLGQPGVARA